jgi:hypothetical protein
MKNLKTATVRLIALFAVIQMLIAGKFSSESEMERLAQGLIGLFTEEDRSILQSISISRIPMDSTYEFIGRSLRGNDHVVTYNNSEIDYTHVNNPAFESYVPDNDQRYNLTAREMVSSLLAKAGILRSAGGMSILASININSPEVMECSSNGLPVVRNVWTHFGHGDNFRYMHTGYSFNNVNFANDRGTFLTGENDITELQVTYNFETGDTSLSLDIGDSIHEPSLSPEFERDLIGYLSMIAVPDLEECLNEVARELGEVPFFDVRQNLGLFVR